MCSKYEIGIKLHYEGSGGKAPTRWTSAHFKCAVMLTVCKGPVQTNMKIIHTCKFNA